MKMQRIGLALAALVASAGSSLAQAPVELWSKAIPASQSSFSVRLGDEGSCVWSFPNTFSGTAAQDLAYGGGSTLVQVANYAAGTAGHHVSAARRHGAAAVLRWPVGASAPVVEHWRLGQQSPASSCTLPSPGTNLAGAGIHCLDDGSASIAWARDAQFPKTRLWRVSSAGAVQWTTAISGDGSLACVRTSHDGSRIVIADMGRTTLLDGTTGATITSYFDMITGQNSQATFAASEDAGTWIQGKQEGVAIIGRRSSDATVRTTLPSLPGYRISGVALSNDGLRAALTYNSEAGDGGMRVRIHERTHATSDAWTLAHHYELQSPSNDTFVVSACSFVEDGQALAVACVTWLDNSNQDDLKLLRRQSNGAWSLEGGLRLPGRIQGIQPLGSGGKFLCTLADSTTVTAYGVLCSSRPVDLAIAGQPRPTLSLQVSMQTTPLGPMRLLTSPRTTNHGVFLGNMGWLRLERASIAMGPLVTANASGAATATLAIPGQSSLVGTSLAVQGYALSPRRLTYDWAKVTVLP